MTKADVSVEDWREYVFSDDFVYRIFDPRTLYVKQKPGGDSHRVIDGKGVTHYIPTGWRVLRWSQPDSEKVSF